ncbi:MAG: aspartate dehydrogenase [Candidatus Tantalella remota]|nr:aspartate dehydrogenase [Candidatus Tantalella remota]
MSAVGIIGCGAIGSALAAHVSEKMSDKIEKMILCDVDGEKVKDLAAKTANAEACSDIGETIEKSDLVIEAVSPVVAPEVLKSAISKNTSVMLMSIGGLLDNEDLLDEARSAGVKVLLPSGAISGIDAIKAARVSGIESVTITTRKAPKSLTGAPYLADKGIDVDSIDDETVIFEGSAREAIKGFPKNVNVAVLLSLAGIGVDKTKVRIVVSPDYTSNTHEIEVISAAGTVATRTQNVPSPTNPKTSYMAALAAITALEGYFDSVSIGT